jgi:hypothetical protein
LRSRFRATCPKLGYLTFIDAFFLTCFFFVFFAIVEMMIAYVVRRRGRTARSRQVHRVSRWLFPVAFLLVNAILTMRYF